MDFVISKVAMSIFALLVASVVGGLLNADMFVRDDSELSSILETLCDHVQRLERCGPGSKTTWTVPFLAAGTSVEVSVERNVARCVSGNGIEMSYIGSCLHLWVWDGTELNESQLDSLDESSGVVRAVSGQTLKLYCQRVLFENDLRNLLFVDAIS